MLVIHWTVLLLILLFSIALAYVYNRKFGDKNFEQVKFLVRVPFFTALFVALIFGINYGYRGEESTEKYRAIGYKDLSNLSYEIVLENEAYADYVRFRTVSATGLFKARKSLEYEMSFEKGFLFGKFYKGDIILIPRASNTNRTLPNHNEGFFPFSKP